MVDLDHPLAGLSSGETPTLKIDRNNAMINTRYKMLTGMHAGNIYVVTAPYSEAESPLRWMLHGETVPDEKLIVSEEELAEGKRWQPLD